MIAQAVFFSTQLADSASGKWLGGPQVLLQGTLSGNVTNVIVTLNACVCPLACMQFFALSPSARRACIEQPAQCMSKPACTFSGRCPHLSCRNLLRDCLPVASWCRASHCCFPVQAGVQPKEQERDGFICGL